MWLAGAEYVPLYEAKMFHHFDHRWATYEGRDSRLLDSAEKSQSACSVFGRYWVEQQHVSQETRDLPDVGGYLAVRRFGRSTDERTIIAAITPPVAFSDGATIVAQRARKPGEGDALLCAYLSSLVLDYVARQKVGAVMINQFILAQLPVLAPTAFDAPCPWSRGVGTVGEWLLKRVLELTYTSWDLEAFAGRCGWSGPPFQWNEDRRFVLRCEVEAAFFHLVLSGSQVSGWQHADGEGADQVNRLRAQVRTPRDAVVHILESFPILRQREEARHGGFRTRTLVLDIYDEMSGAIRDGRVLSSRVSPPPGPPESPLSSGRDGRPSSVGWPSHVHWPQRPEGE